MTDPQKQIDQIEEALKDDEAELDGDLETGVEDVEREEAPPHFNPDHARDGGVF